MFRISTLFTLTFFSILASAESGPQHATPEKPMPELQCVSLDRTSSCGCSLKIIAQECIQPVNEDEEGGRVHLFSELHQGAPLYLRIAGKELSLPSLRTVEHVFRYGEGDSWQEAYEGEGIKVHLSYRPGQSDCPPEKEEGCENFNVEADLELILEGAKPLLYQTVGSCGC